MKRERERERERGINYFKSFLITTILLFSLVLRSNANAVLYETGGTDGNIADVTVEDDTNGILFNITGDPITITNSTITTSVKRVGEVPDDKPAFEIRAGIINLDGTTLGTSDKDAVFSIGTGAIVNFASGTNTINSAGAFNVDGGTINVSGGTNTITFGISGNAVFDSNAILKLFNDSVINIGDLDNTTAVLTLNKYGSDKSIPDVTGTIKLEDNTTINLYGILNSNIEGTKYKTDGSTNPMLDDDGYTMFSTAILNIKSADAVVNGRVSYANIVLDYVSETSRDITEILNTPSTSTLGNLTISEYVKFGINNTMRIISSIALGGELNLNNGTIIVNRVFNVTGGELNINGGTIGVREIFNITGGTINIADLVIEEVRKKSKITLGEYNEALSDDNNLVLNNATLNVGSATDTTASTLDVQAYSGTDYVKGKIVLIGNDTVINLYGILISNITGAGTLAIKNIDALVNGAIDSTNLTLSVDTGNISFNNFKINDNEFYNELTFANVNIASGSDFTIGAGKILNVTDNTTLAGTLKIGSTGAFNVASTGTINATGTSTITFGEVNNDSVSTNNLILNGAILNVGDANDTTTTTLTINRYDQNADTTGTIGNIALSGTGATINLYGILNSGITGTGTLNILSNEAFVNGNVSGVNLVLDYDSGNNDDKYLSEILYSMGEFGVVTIGEKVIVGVTPDLTASSVILNGKMNLLSTLNSDITGTGILAIKGVHALVNGGTIDTNLTLEVDATGISFGNFKNANGEDVDELTFANVNINSRKYFTVGTGKTLNVTNNTTLNGTLNLSGELNSNIGGTGTLNIASDSAVISGNVSGVNLALNYSGSRNITGIVTGTRSFANVDIGEDATFGLDVAIAITGSVGGTGTLNISNTDATITGNISNINLILGYGDTDKNIKQIIATDNNSIIGELASITVNENSTLNLGTESLEADGEFKVYNNSTVTLHLTGTSAVAKYGNITANSYDIGETAKLKLFVDNFDFDNTKKQLINIFKGDGVDDITTEDNFNPIEIDDNALYKFEYVGGEVKEEKDREDNEPEDATYMAGSYRVIKLSSNTARENVRDALAIISSNSSSNALANTNKVVNAWFGAISSDSNDENSTLIAESGVGLKLSALAQDININNLDKATAEKLKDVLVALAPDTSPIVQSNTTSTLNAVTFAVGSRLTGGLSSPTSFSGLSSGDSSNINKNVWIQGLYNISEFSPNEKTNNFKANTSGVAIGLEGKFNDILTAGISYANTKADIDGYLRNTDVLTNTFVLYGEYKQSQLFYNGIVAIGTSKYKEARTLDNELVTAKYKANTLAFQVGAGYEISDDITNTTPTISLRYLRVDVDGYTDSSNIQHASANKVVNLTATVGVKFDKEFSIKNNIAKNTKLRPEVKLGLSNDLISKVDDITVALGNNNNFSYTIKGEELNSTSFEIGLGITGKINDKFTVSINYDGQFRTDYVDNTVLIRVGFNF